MPKFPTWSKIVAIPVLAVVGVAIPETGWLDQGSARLITVACGLVIAAIALPALARWLLPVVRVEVDAPPAAKAWRAWRKRGGPEAVPAQPSQSPGSSATDAPPLMPPETPSPIPSAAVISHWWPDPTDLGSVAITAEDLDRCMEQASEIAQSALAPDAKVEFEDMKIGLAIAVQFRAWSKTAAKSMRIAVAEDQVIQSEIYVGSMYKNLDDDGNEHDLWPDPEPAPWHVDTTWRELIQMTWYRLRPLTGPLTVHAGYRAVEDQEAWNLWYACLVRQMGAPLELRKCYGLWKGELREFEWA